METSSSTSSVTDGKTQNIILENLIKLANDTKIDGAIRNGLHYVSNIFQNTFSGKSKDDDYKLFVCLYAGMKLHQTFDSTDFINEVILRSKNKLIYEFILWLQDVMGLPALSQSQLSIILKARTATDSLQLVKENMVANAKYSNTQNMIPLIQENIDKLIKTGDVECTTHIFNMYEEARMFEEKCYKSIKASRLSKEVSELIDTKWVHEHTSNPPNYKLSTQYSPERKNKIMCSIDLKQANFTALHFIGRELKLSGCGLFEGKEEFPVWKDFASLFTSNQLLINNKKTRNSIINRFCNTVPLAGSTKKISEKLVTAPLHGYKAHGKTNEQRKNANKERLSTLIDIVQESLMCVIDDCLKQLSSTFGEIAITYRGHDEIMFTTSIVEEKEAKNLTEELTKRLNTLIPAEHSWLNHYLNISTFKIHCFVLDDKSICYCKEYYDGNKNGFEFKMVAPQNRKEAYDKYMRIKNPAA